MRYSRYAILAFLLLVNIGAGIAQTITVTNNSDSGPGTLREALITAANNGTATKDVINFNLSGGGLNGNTIRLRSQLPAVTSNVTIDGSTQPGQPLGVSGAKIIIEPELPLFKGFTGLVIGANPYTSTNNINYQTTDVEIYGLYIRKFSIVTSLVPGNQLAGITLDYRVDRIKIGAAGKGNVIGGNTYGIYLRNNTNSADLLNKQDQISIQGNLIGVTDDGFTDESNIIGIQGDISYSALSIGGDALSEANVIAANLVDINLDRIYNSSQPMLLNIFNNKIGTDFTGTKSYKNIPLFSGSSTVQMNGIRVSAGNTTVNISKNIISGHLTTGLYLINSEFVVTGNYIGTGITGNETNMGNGSGIRLEGSATGTIGGSAATDPNFIGYNTFGIESFSSRPVKITRNSIFCNTQIGIGKVTSGATQAFIQVLKINGGSISGKSNPGAEIELFYTDGCVGTCQGKTYIATERAGVDGRWTFNGTISGSITATASISNGVTSQFSTAGLLPNEAIVDPVTCKGLGSVTITEPREGITFNWYKLEADGSAGYIINTQSIAGLDVGNYEVRIGDGCSVVAHRFAITDQIMTVLNVIEPQPQCGQTSFIFTASVFRGKGTIRYVWTNAAGNIVANGTSVNLPEGKYKVTATDEAGCIKSHDFNSITRRLKPRIVVPSPNSWTAQCGKTDGFIRGFTVADSQGTVTYTWSHYNYVNGVWVIGDEIQSSTTTADIINLAGGNYILEVTDQGGCSPAVPYIATVNTTRSVVITNASPVNTTCNSNNGALNAITIVEGNNYRLTTAAGILVTSGTCNPGVPFNIPNLAAGNYWLYASNTTTLCEATPRDFTITAIPIIQYAAQNSITNASCDQNNGAIRLTYSNNLRPLNGRYRWENAAGDEYPGTVDRVENLPDGTYMLKITDPNGCTSNPLGPFILDRIPLLIVDKNIGQVMDDVCALGRGSVTGVKITGGLPLSGSGDDAVYKYTWRDAAGTIVRSTRDLIDIGAGEYYLEVKDQTECGIDFSKVFVIGAPTVVLPTPTVNSLRVCYATEIMLPIIAPEEGTYQMYIHEDDPIPLMETTNGRFVFKVSKTGDYKIRRKLGTCYSEFTTVHVEVTNDNLDIKNTMTPNGDGMNDYWTINGLPDVDISIMIYTRSGQLVYESLGRYTKPFNGRFRGKELPAGAYYYKIDLRADCKPIAGSITLLR